MYILNNRL
ncbi:hypothetical protein YPPY48_1758, partial [Yersinia pestis PY-48]